MPSFWNNTMHSRINVYGPRKVQTRGRFGRTHTVTQPGASLEVGAVVVLGGIVAVGIIGAELVAHGAKSAYRGLVNQKPRIESLLESISSGVNSIVAKIGGESTTDELLVGFSKVSGMSVEHLRSCGVEDQEGVCIAAMPFYELDHTPTTIKEVTEIAKAAGKLQ